MKSSLDVLFLRRPILNYTSPPICDVLFSSSSGPVIVLNALGHLTGVTGGIAGGSGRFRLSWDSYPGALCYSVYQATDSAHPETSEYVIVAECINDTFFEPSTDGCFRISAITTDGETPLSAFFCSGPNYGPPEVITDDADNVASASARLNGQVNPSGFPTSAYFQYGLTTGYGLNTAPQDMGDSTNFSPFSEDIIGLSGSTTYHFRAVGVNANGTTYGEDKSFTTPGGGGGGGPIPLLYWEFEDLSFDVEIIDSVRSEPLIFEFGTAGSSVPGIIGNGCFSNSGAYGTNSIPILGYAPGGTFTICGWLSAPAGTSDGDSCSGITYFTAPGSGVQIGWLNTTGTINFFMVCGPAGPPPITFSGPAMTPDVKYFFRMWYDGILHVIINEDGVDYPSVPFVLDPNAIGGIALGNDFPAGSIFDELGFWNRVLTNAEGLFLYNSGAGQRPPFA